MSKIKELKIFNPEATRERFKKQIVQDMNAKQRDDLDKAFLEGLNKDEKEHEQKCSEIKMHNTNVFLEDPISSIVQINNQAKNDFWNVGELLMLSGIGKITMKRFGKGTLVGKGTLGEGTVSNFTIKAEIGNVCFTETISSRNDKHIKDRMKVATLNMLGISIIKEFLNKHPEKENELEPVQHKLRNLKLKSKK